MNRTYLHALLAALCAAHWHVAEAEDLYAQSEAPRAQAEAARAQAESARTQAEAWRRWSEDFSREMRASMGALFGGRMASGKLVKGAPYSADVITEMNQPLADGNVISRKTAGRVYRDGEGRSRQESGTAGETSIFINDPVAGQHVVLNPGTKRATVRTVAAPGARFENRNTEVVRVDGKEEIRIEDGKVFLNGQEVTGGNLVMKAKSGKEVKVENGRITIDGKDVGSLGGSGSEVRVSREVVDGMPREEVRVKVVRMGDDPPPPMPPIPSMPPTPPPPSMRAPVAPVPPVPPLPPMPGVDTFHFESTAGLGKGVTTQLGVKDFEGVKAEGTSTVWTIPAGKVGNRNAINVTKEWWYSPDLQVVVYTRHNDPRTGESIYRLASIKRAEPSPDLFKVPEGYSVRGRDRGGATPPPSAPGAPG
jgi:hypothetical protein